ncbi:MAG TPA: hypothetical protein VNE61_05020 [Ktedonobacteraceae bacterium]|nr:hypothetical protein [Ktedonobacteraceae bacterium]
MPKKNAAQQRNRPRVQKHFEVVRPSAAEAPPEESNSPEAISASDAAVDSQETASIVEQEQQPISNGVAGSASTRSSAASRRARARAGRAATVDSTVASKEAVKEEIAEAVIVEAKESSNGSDALPKGSAAARLAARRQATQRAQQKSGAALITPEHYAYVRRDLMVIAILAIIMFSVIIILHFVPGIGY